MRGVFLVILAVACAAGCGNPNGTVKVTGKVSIGGQPPPAEGRVTFTVVKPADGFPNRPAMAKFGTDGKYSATTYDPGDGLLPGSYKIFVECYETPPNMEGKPVKSHVDKKYMNGETSGLELLIEPKSKPIDFDIDIELE